MKKMNSMNDLVKFIPLLFGALIFSSCEKESVIPEADLPAEATTFITTHFPGESITQVVKERDDLTVSYDVFLGNGIALDFNKKGEIQSIEGAQELPDSVIPENILEYVNQNFSEHHITQWELDRKEQDVQISNGLELKFDKNGSFLRIDN